MEESGQQGTGGQELRDLDTLCGTVLTTRKLVIANRSDPRLSGGGLPARHSELSAFLGVPVCYGNKLVGVIGLANQKEGYGEDHASAAVVVDLPVALAAAGSLASVPVGVILDDLKEKYVDDTSRENLYEVLNIAACLFNATGEKHLRLTAMTETTSKPEGDLKAVIDSTLHRLDLEVTLAPCPAGRFVILQAA